MPKTEKALSTSLKQKLPKKSHYQRIENRAGEGMPDVYMCLDGVPIWLELKIIKSNRITVNKSQIAWHLGHSRCNGVSFFLLHDPSKGDVLLFDGSFAFKFQGSGIDVLRPAALYDGDLKGLPCVLRAKAIDAWLCVLRPAT